MSNETRKRTLLGAFDDDASRAILEASSDQANSARELSEHCDLPISTVYRKLEQLTDAGLLAERTRIRQSGKHSSEYVRAIEEVTVSIDSCGELDVTIRHSPD